jgi:hypothetical protein
MRKVFLRDRVVSDEMVVGGPWWISGLFLCSTDTSIPHIPHAPKFSDASSIRSFLLISVSIRGHSM